MGELKTPLWFGEVDAGSTHERTITVTNNGGVALPYAWQQTEREMLTLEVSPRLSVSPPPMLLVIKMPSRPARSASFPEQNIDKSKQLNLDEKGGSDLQLAVREELDLTLLGVVRKYFLITPDKGQLDPGQSETFTISFQPGRLRRYQYWAQLLVDTAIAGTPGTEPDTIAAEVGSSGLSAECHPWAISTLCKLGTSLVVRLALMALARRWRRR